MTDVPEPRIFRCPSCKSTILITVLERPMAPEELQGVPGPSLNCLFCDHPGCIYTELEEIHPVSEEGLDQWLKDT